MRVSRQIGWSDKSNVLYNILQELDAISCKIACSTTTTSSTIAPLVSLEVNNGSDCNTINPIIIYTSSACSVSLDIDCEIWQDAEGTIPFDGAFNNASTLVYYVTGGVITTIEPCPF